MESFKEVLLTGQTFGIIGGGTMAKAIAFPLFEKGLLHPTPVTVSTITEKSMEAWQEFGCTTTTDNEQILRDCDVILWAIKPQEFVKVYNSLSQHSSDIDKRPKSTIHISVMAGIPILHFHEKMEKLYYQGRIRTIKVNPNLAMKVSCGVAAYTLGKNGTDEDRKWIVNFFKPLGLCFELSEGQMNGYFCPTGLMFPILEAMSDGAVKMGIPRATSLEIVAQVMKGAGELLLKEKVHPGVLKDTVCSPGGTTIAGIAAMEQNGVRHAIISAIEAATKHSQALVKSDES